MEGLLLLPGIDKVVSKPLIASKKRRALADINSMFDAILWYMFSLKYILNLFPFRTPPIYVSYIYDDFLIPQQQLHQNQQF